jgi:hypothetical protein
MRLAQDQCPGPLQTSDTLGLSILRFSTSHFGTLCLSTPNHVWRQAAASPRRHTLNVYDVFYPDQNPIQGEGFFRVRVMFRQHLGLPAQTLKSICFRKKGQDLGFTLSEKRFEAVNSFKQPQLHQHNLSYQATEQR